MGKQLAQEDVVLRVGTQIDDLGQHREAIAVHMQREAHSFLPLYGLCRRISVGRLTTPIKQLL
ncbi:hypothetical protein PSE10C_13900 [Pseudomonas amygdali pv. eriobotryae]|uniref:Uncharacterized protein n=1 Tax=Pseudomonas amygdali pv. eriobotryae TaxID=129137 RepID=A0A9P3AAE6_PSEA0|nr:hypothetical protein PSE10A_13240 [Pseudomonas amygdali pv. eriobotryae]GFZ70648.1 hypothetical protein PSE10C_13900 [Pseudomonas amygdali pv. eriobotryae]